MNSLKFMKWVKILVLSIVTNRIAFLLKWWIVWIFSPLFELTILHLNSLTFINMCELLKSIVKVWNTCQNTVKKIHILLNVFHKPYFDTFIVSTHAKFLNRKTFNSILNCLEKCSNTNYTHHYLGIWQQFLLTSLFFCFTSLFFVFFFHFLFVNLLALNLNNENARW